MESTRSQPRSCWPLVTSGRTHEPTIEPSCRSESCCVPPFVRMVLPALNTYWHENGWAPVFVTQSGRHRNPIKCTKMVPSDPKVNALQVSGFTILIEPLVFPLFWNEMTKKCQIFTKFQRCLTFTNIYDVIFRRKYAKPGSIRKYVA